MCMCPSGTSAPECVQNWPALRIRAPRLRSQAHQVSAIRAVWCSDPTWPLRCLSPGERDLCFGFASARASALGLSLLGPMF